jgi:hypothetical protein
MKPDVQYLKKIKLIKLALRSINFILSYRQLIEQYII